MKCYRAVHGHPHQWSIPLRKLGRAAASSTEKVGTTSKEQPYTDRRSAARGVPKNQQNGDARAIGGTPTAATRCSGGQQRIGRMNIFYIIGVVVVILAVLSFLGLR